MIKLKLQKKTLDKGLLILVILLTLFGVLMVYNASAREAVMDFNDQYYYLKYQLLWAAIGFVLLFVFSLIKYSVWKTIAPLAFFINVILLILVLIPGIGTTVQGARRWLNFGFINIQPAEFIKLTLIIYLATWLKDKRPLGKFLILVSLIFGLIILEPDLGTAVVVSGLAFLIYYASGANLISIFSIGLLGLLSGLAAIFSSDYRKQRLLTFLNPNTDPLGSSYHIRQIVLALSLGGIFGLGLGQSRQKYNYLPEVATDSIFAIIAEELGFIGALAVIGILFIIIYKAFNIAKKAPDRFSQLLASGIAIWISLQIIINLGAMVALIPLTGLPLPFISYGGSSLIMILIAMGILLNISKYQIVKK